MTCIVKDLTDEEYQARLLADWERKQRILVTTSWPSTATRMHNDIAVIVAELDLITEPSWQQERQRLRYIYEAADAAVLRRYGVIDPQR